MDNKIQKDNLNNIKFTIIIPVYNGELFLGECLDSLILQTEKAWEAICVNDGSKDTSQQILENYAKKDERIKAHFQHNSGVSTARNNALDLAKGKFILFLDCDDWMSPDALKILGQSAEQNPKDFSMGGIIRCSKQDDPNGLAMNAHLLYHPKKTQSYPITAEGIAKTYPYVWGKIFLRDLIEQNQLRFSPDVPLTQDKYFMYRYAMLTDSFTIIPDVCVFYRDNQMSATGTASKMEKSCEHYTAVYKDDKKLFAAAKKLPKNKRQKWQIGLLWSHIGASRYRYHILKISKQNRPDLVAAMKSAAKEIIKELPLYIVIQFTYLYGLNYIKSKLK